MIKTALVASAAFLLVPLSAFGAPDIRPPGTFPLISGKYLVSGTRVCQPAVQVTYGNINGANVVTGSP